MNRTGLIIALGIATIAGAVFGIFPGLDLRIASVFYAIRDAHHNMFSLRFSPALLSLRDAGLWVSTVLIAPAVISLAIKLVLPRRKLLMSGRAIVFLMVTMALGPGLLVNVALKEHWGRSRPIDVTQFGGTEHFVAWWDPRGDCPSNCSFVSGDVSGAFWNIAPAALAPPQWRALAYGGALALGTTMAVFRMMAGGHFPSDVIFAGVFTFLIVWLAYALIYRWPRTRLTDAAVESALERIAMPGYRVIHRLLGKKID